MSPLFSSPEDIKKIAFHKLGKDYLLKIKYFGPAKNPFIF